MFAETGVRWEQDGPQEPGCGDSEATLGGVWLWLARLCGFGLLSTTRRERGSSRLRRVCLRLYLEVSVFHARQHNHNRRVARTLCSVASLTGRHVSTEKY